MLLKKFIFTLFITALLHPIVSEAGNNKEKSSQNNENQEQTQNTTTPQQNESQEPLEEKPEEKFAYQASKEDIDLFKAFVEMNKTAEATKKNFEKTSRQLLQTSIEDQDPFALQITQQLTAIQEEFERTKQSMSSVIFQALSDISHIKADKQRKKFIKQKNTKKEDLEGEIIEKKIKKD